MIFSLNGVYMDIFIHVCRYLEETIFLIIRSDSFFVFSRVSGLLNHDDNLVC